MVYKIILIDTDQEGRECLHQQFLLSKAEVKLTSLKDWF